MEKEYLVIEDGVLKKLKEGVDNNSIKDVTIPEGVTAIGVKAFYECRELASVTIPNSVKEIGDHAFGLNYSLKRVTIPGSVTKIGNSAFFKCDALESMAIKNGVEEIGKYAFYWCAAIASVEIPATVTKIGEYAFGECHELKEIKYTGTKAQWEKIELEEKVFSDMINHGLKVTVHCTDGAVECPVVKAEPDLK